MRSTDRHMGAPPSPDSLQQTETPGITANAEVLAQAAASVAAASGTEKPMQIVYLWISQCHWHPQLKQ